LRSKSTGHLSYRRIISKTEILRQKLKFWSLITKNLSDTKQIIILRKKS
jgi:hypothetical protein